MLSRVTGRESDENFAGTFLFSSSSSLTRYAVHLLNTIFIFYLMFYTVVSTVCICTEKFQSEKIWRLGVKVSFYLFLLLYSGTATHPWTDVC